MIHRSEDRKTVRTDGMKGGIGYMLSRSYINSPDDLWGKGRLFGLTTLEKNCEVGWHVHDGDGEIYCIVSGEGEYNDNGKTVTVYPGDVTFTPSGEGHSLKNLRDEPLVFVALILYM